jgi:hypothetical protein
MECQSLISGDANMFIWTLCLSLAASAIGESTGSKSLVLNQLFVALPTKNAKTFGIGHYTVQSIEPATMTTMYPVRTIVRRIEGCLMAAMLRPGMTRVQAQKIIAVLRVDSGQFFPWSYWFTDNTYGITLSFDKDDQGEWRLAKIRLNPFLKLSSNLP